MGDAVTPSVVVVADAHQDAGLGHLSRSSSVAVALRCHGVETIAYSLGAATGFVRDGVPWEPATVEAVCAARANIVVLDSYELDPEDLPADIDVVAMHDYGGAPDRARLVVQVAGNPGAGDPRLLAGGSFACLRPSFWGLPRREVAGEVRTVLVATGAGDLGDAAALLTAAARKGAPHAEVALVRGPHAVSPAPADVRVLEAPETLLQPLLEADLVITAGGQTLLEAAATGAPTVAVPLVENQRRHAESLARAGAAALATVDDVAKRVGVLSDDRAARAALAEGAQRTVDGYGALRVAFAIAHLR